MTHNRSLLKITLSVKEKLLDVDVYDDISTLLIVLYVEFFGVAAGRNEKAAAAELSYQVGRKDSQNGGNRHYAVFPRSSGARRQPAGPGSTGHAGACLLMRRVKLKARGSPSVSKRVQNRLKRK